MIKHMTRKIAKSLVTTGLARVREATSNKPGVKGSKIIFIVVIEIT